MIHLRYDVKLLFIINKKNRLFWVELKRKQKEPEKKHIIQQPKTHQQQLTLQIFFSHFSCSFKFRLLFSCPKTTWQVSSPNNSYFKSLNLLLNIHRLYFILVPVFEIYLSFNVSIIFLQCNRLTVSTLFEYHL